MKKKIIMIIVSLFFMFTYLYLFLPAINFHSTGFYFYLFLCLGIIAYNILIFCKPKLIQRYFQKTFTISYNQGNQIHKKSIDAQQYFTDSRIFWMSLISAIAVFLIFVIIYGIIGSKLFRAKSYYSQLPIEEGTQEEFVSAFNYDSSEIILPIIDKDLAFKLAQANLGNYGSQYTIDYDNFTLINVNRNGTNCLLRIAPLEYSNFFVALNRMNEGSIGYIEVNVYTKETRLVTFEQGLKYMPSGIFSKDLDRHIRFNHLGEMYDAKNFEIDDEGNPYWVMPTYTNQIGVTHGAMPTGTIIVNPITGETKKYALGMEPLWVDRVVNDTICQEQATNALKYKNGFFNVFIGAKKEVFQLSDGYNYLVKDGHTFYISCITSPNESDQTSIGFICIDLKTKEAKKYLIPGITEMRAREIAQMDARVKAQSLTATWPILIDYHGVETYFVVLKNDVQSQKIVFINVKNGEQIAMGNTIEEAKDEYDKLLVNSGTTVSMDKSFEGKVIKLRDLTSTIEFMIDSVTNKYFVVRADLNLDSRFLKITDNVLITCKEYNDYYYVTAITVTN